MSPSVKKQSLPVGKKPTTAKLSASPRKKAAPKDGSKETGGLKKIKPEDARTSTL